MVLGESWIEVPDAIQAADDRECDRDRVVGATGNRLDCRTQGGGVDMHDRLALVRNWLGEWLAARRRSESAQYSGVQGRAGNSRRPHRNQPVDDAELADQPSGA